MSVSLTASGLVMPATQSASADANTMDDYEEGTYNVAFTAGTGSVTVNSANDLMSYVKIGIICQVLGLAQASSVSSPGGLLKMTGLPFTPIASAEGSDYSCCSIEMDTNSGNFSRVPYFRIDTGSANASIYDFNGANIGESAAEHVKAGTTFRINGSYIVA